MHRTPIAEPRAEDAFDPRFERTHLLDQLVQLCLGDAAPVDPAREPRARASENHLRGDEDERDRNDGVRSWRERDDVDRREDDQQSAPDA
jgi:hypothetical protein